MKNPLFLLILCATVWLEAAAQSMPQAPELTSRAYLVLDMSSDQTLASKAADEPVQPASLSKLMTAYLVFEALRMDRLDLKQALPVSEQAMRQPGSRMFIDTSMRVPVDDLIKGLLVQSGNDAAWVLAEAVGGSAQRFVQLMNEQAESMGMKSTRFLNPTGLPVAGQVSTARDLAVLATRLLRDFPEHGHFYALRKFRYAGTPAANDSNRNLLLYRDPSVDGLKTGHTDGAGYCLIVSARREFPNLGVQGTPGVRRLLAVVLGAENEQVRATEAQKLLNWGYSAFEAVKLFEGNQAILEPAIWKGRAQHVQLGRPQAVVVTVPTGSANQLRTQAIRPDPLVAPVVKGQRMGVLKIYVGERLLSEKSLLVLDGVAEAGLLGRAWDALRLMAD